MGNLQLYCISHKPFDLPKVSNFDTLQVGNNPEQFGTYRDNTGDNIADKNGEYSELTGHYFVWKNLRSDHVGFCHYRRYLLPPASRDWLRQIVPQKHGTGFRIPQAALTDHLNSTGDRYVDSFEALLTKVDIILPRSVPLGSGGFINQYLSIHDAAPLFRVIALLAEEDDNLGKAAYRYFTQATQGHWNNMYIARWEVFDRYCQFLFPLLEKLEQEIVLPESSYQRRVYAFLAERLFNFWLVRNRVSAALLDWCIVEESLTVNEPHHISRA